MKQSTLVILMILLGIGHSLAQITLTRNLVPSLGDSITYAIDTTVAELSPGLAGENQNWNYSQLDTHQLLSIVFVDPALTAQASLFPDANIATVISNSTTYLSLSDTALFLLGARLEGAELFGLDVLRFDPPEKLYQFPITFGSTFTDTSGIDVTVDGSIINPLIDSLRLVRTDASVVTIDAWGEITTPAGTFPCLRQRTITVSVDSVYALLFGSWSPFLQQRSSTTEYQWLSVESKGTVLTMTLSEEGAVEEIQYFLHIANANVQAPAAAFSIENLGAGSFAFTDQSGNQPNQWLWDFGDGQTSTAQNPQHTYSAPGAYPVCLTATNAFGSSTVCQTVLASFTGTREVYAPLPIRIFPNPATELVTFAPDTPSGEAFQLFLYDAQGRMVLQQAVRGQTTVSVKQLPAGTYFFHLLDEPGQRAARGQLQVR